MNKKQIKRGVVGIVLVFLLSIVLPVGQVIAQDSEYGDEYIDIIIRYKESVPEEESLDPRFKNVQTMDILPIQTMSVPASAIRELSLEKNIRRITYDQEVTTSQSPYEVSSDDWNQTMIGTFDAWEEGYTGKDVDIAILDTGFYQHPDITYAGGHSIFGEDDELGPDVWTNDHSGHGTHVAGILGAKQGTRAQGIAPDADIYGVKIYHESKGDKTRVGNLLTGLNWAIQNDSDIIVISSGYPDHNQEVYDTIQEAYAQGILIFAASGNITDNNGTIDYPAVHDEVIAVSGVNQRQARVSDSMVGPENELAAPGQNILSLSPDGAYSTMSGTSQAAPHVAGIAALLMEKHPSESPDAIRQRLIEQALDLGDPGHDVLYGHGLVQFGEKQPEEPEPEDDTVEDPEETEEETDSVSDDDETSEDTDSESENTETDSEETTDSETDPEQSNETQNETEDDDSSSENSNETVDNNDEETTSEEEDFYSNNENEIEENDDPAQHSTIWIRPSETNGVATVAQEDIEAVPNNGVLAISFDSSLGHIERISLSREQVKILKDKNVKLLIARVDLEWVIPIDNLSEGNALITFESTAQELKAKAITKGKILSFGIEQEGERLTTFPSEMTYRFFTPEVEYNQDALYRWNESTESWELLGDAYTKGGVVGVTSEVGTLAVFNPEELETAIATAKEEKVAEEEVQETEEKEVEESEPDVVEETEIEFSEEESSGLPVVLSSVVVVLMSVTGGLYFFGGKSKD
ncbi:S8 family peptidase [Alkalibacterium sp. f15]|uniref:S8 family peptidase n=1 Tax=Alkalibacterium sp. f15 TaxID=3414029 RepID=UPI003BF8990C